MLACVIIGLMSICRTVLLPSQGHKSLILLNVPLPAPGTALEVECGKMLCSLKTEKEKNNKTLKGDN